MLDPLLSVALLALAALSVTASLWVARAWPAQRRRWTLGGVALGLLALPLLQPRIPHLPMVGIAFLCPVMVLKLRDLHIGAAWWQTQTLSRWLAYVANPVVLVPRRHLDQPPAARGATLLRLARGVSQIAAGTWLLGAVNGWDASFAPWHVAKSLAAYIAAFDGVLITMESLLRLGGLNVQPYIQEALFSRTPADFWRRYNMEAGRWFEEDLFKPVGGWRRPVFGTALVFTASGLLHEYLAYMLVGRVQGYQMAFFALHGIAVIATARLRLRGWRAVAGWACTFVFVMATMLLFFSSVDAIAPGWFYPNGAPLP